MGGCVDGRMSGCVGVGMGRWVYGRMSVWMEAMHACRVTTGFSHGQRYGCSSAPAKHWHMCGSSAHTHHQADLRLPDQAHHRGLRSRRQCLQRARRTRRRDAAAAAASTSAQGGHSCQQLPHCQPCAAPRGLVCCHRARTAHTAHRQRHLPLLHPAASRRRRRSRCRGRRRRTRAATTTTCTRGHTAGACGPADTRLRVEGDGVAPQDTRVQATQSRVADAGYSWQRQAEVAAFGGGGGPMKRNARAFGRGGGAACGLGIVCAACCCRGDTCTILQAMRSHVQGHVRFQTGGVPRRWRAPQCGIRPFRTYAPSNRTCWG